MLAVLQSINWSCPAQTTVRHVRGSLSPVPGGVQKEAVRQIKSLEEQQRREAKTNNQKINRGWRVGTTHACAVGCVITSRLGARARVLQMYGTVSMRLKGDWGAARTTRAAAGQQRRMRKDGLRDGCSADAGANRVMQVLPVARVALSCRGLV